MQLVVVGPGEGGKAMVRGLCANLVKMCVYVSKKKKLTLTPVILHSFRSALRGPLRGFWPVIWETDMKVNPCHPR